MLFRSGVNMCPCARIVDHDHSRNGDSPEDVKGKNTFVCFYCITHNFRCVKLVLGCCQRLCALIYEVGNGHIWDTGVGCQSDFTGAAVGVTDADAGSLYLWTELTQGVGIQFGIREASVAGKSTLVRCLNLLERPTSGTVKVNGKNLTELSEKELRKERQKIGMIFQHFNLLMQRTALDNVCFPMEIAGIGKAEARKKALEYLRIVGLEEKALSYPSQLSGGQKQRVAIEIGRAHV